MFLKKCPLIGVKSIPFFYLLIMSTVATSQTNVCLEVSQERNIEIIQNYLPETTDSRLFFQGIAAASLANRLDVVCAFKALGFLDNNFQSHPSYSPDEAFLDALHWASTHGYIEVLRVLVSSSRFNIDAKRSSSSLEPTVFKEAVEICQTEAANILLNAGAQVDVNTSSLIRASECPSKDLVLGLLDRGVRPSTTALYAAARNGHTENVSLLLSRGVPVYTGTNEFRLASVLANENGHYELARTLRRIEERRRGTLREPRD